MIGWHEPEEAITANWIKKSNYPKAVLKHRVSDLVSLITLAASGLGMGILLVTLEIAILALSMPLFKSLSLIAVSGFSCIVTFVIPPRVRLFVDFLARRYNQGDINFESQVLSDSLDLCSSPILQQDLACPATLSCAGPV